MARTVQGRGGGMAHKVPGAEAYWIKARGRRTDAHGAGHCTGSRAGGVTRTVSGRRNGAHSARTGRRNGAPSARSRSRDGRAESLAGTAARSRSLGRPRGVAPGTAARMGELTGTTRSPPSNQHVLLDLPPYRRRHSCRIWGNFGFERCRSKRRRHHSGSVHVCARMGQARAWRGSLRESANVNCQLICPQCLQCNRVVRYGGGQNWWPVNRLLRLRIIFSFLFVESPARRILGLKKQNRNQRKLKNIWWELRVSRESPTKAHKVAEVGV